MRRVFDDGTYGAYARSMPELPWFVPFLRPTPVAIHNDCNMLGDLPVDLASN